MQATMFEPVGGMDRIPAAFHKSIKSLIMLGAELRLFILIAGVAKATASQPILWSAWYRCLFLLG